MQEFKGTPGEWREYAGFVVKDVDESGDWWELATVSDQAPDDERLANARLISAAPDLLEALQEATAALEEQVNDYDVPTERAWAAIEKARAAIAKALGS